MRAPLRQTRRRVEIVLSVPGRCVNWTGQIDRYGYGRRGGKLAHRLAWEEKNGPIPDGLVIDHMCRNRRCVNVAHLRLLTNAENASLRADRTANGRCKNGHAFTPDNTRIHRPKGRNPYRICRTCERDAGRRYLARKKAQRAADSRSISPKEGSS